MGLVGALVWVAPAALADSNDNGGFEGFALGDPVGQSGWTANDVGAYHASNFDVAIVDPSAVWGSALGSRALRVSNAVTSNGFGNQLQSPSLANDAGETDAVNSALSGGTRQTRFSGTISFASATQTYQPGLVFGFFPDRGDGARMANFRISDQPDGLRLEVSLVDLEAENFVYHTIASGLSRTEVHTLEFTLDFVDGSNNDVLWLGVDDSACTTFSASGSWEEYHRQWANNIPPITFPVDSIMFRVYNPPAPANAGGGILFDTFNFSSSTVPAMRGEGPPAAPQAPVATVDGQAVHVTTSAPATNRCQPVTSYTATLTPEGGGTPITLTGPTPDFDFDGVPPGTYTITVIATNIVGASDPSQGSTATVAALTSPSPSPSPDPSDTDGDGNPDDELANTGPTLAPLAAVALGLVALGFVARRRA
jgi:hypothetical protein